MNSILPMAVTSVLVGGMLEASTAPAHIGAQIRGVNDVVVAPEHYLVTRPLPSGSPFVLYAVDETGKRTVIATDIVIADEDHGALQTWNVPRAMRDTSFVAVSASGTYPFFDPFDSSTDASTGASSPAHLGNAYGGGVGVLALSFTASQMTLSSPALGRERKVKISGVSPTSGGAGTLVTITGGGFPEDDLDVCSLIMDGNGQIAGMLEVQTSSPTQITARLVAVAPGATVGQVSIAIGDGVHVMAPPPPPAPTMQFQAPGAWFWLPNASTRSVLAASTFTFTTALATPPHACTSYFGQLNPTSGWIEIHLPNTTPYPNNSQLSMQVDARSTSATSPGYWFDMYGDLGLVNAPPEGIRPALGAALLAQQLQLAFFNATGQILSVIASSTANDIVVSVFPPLGESWLNGSIYITNCAW